MMKTLGKAMALGFLALAACAPVSTTTVSIDPTGSLATCPAPAFQHLVGNPYDSVAVVWPNLRVIRPYDMVTKDYLLDRLNIDLDAAGVITRVWCG